ncbi:MAG: hypothetical protein LBF49_03200, partial [Puniceicoccales bacterium]|nr:hypothetical protein [Puniceicoccales bacterium]
MACLVGIFCHGSAVAAALNGTIEDPEASAQEWQIDNSADNKVTFRDQDGERKGSISVTSDNSTPAASVTFDGEFDVEQK